MVNQHASTMPHTSADARGDQRTVREDALTTALLVGGVAGGWGFLGVAFAAGALREDYSALHQPVSMLSLGPGGWVQIANFVVSGLLMVACAVGLRRALRSGRGRTWGPLLIGVYGFGLVGAGAFSADPSYGYPPGAALGPAASYSVHGMLHEVAGFVVFGPLTGACFVFARRFAAQAGRRGWAIYSFLTGLAMPVFIAGAFNAWSSGMAANFGGVFQRLALAAGWAWISLLALSVIREKEVVDGS
jgi:hypothetical protein